MYNIEKIIEYFNKLKEEINEISIEDIEKNIDILLEINHEIEGFFNKINSLAELRASKGFSFINYDYIGVSRREITKENIDLLKKMPNHERYFTTIEKIKTITELESILGKEMVKNLTIKKESKPSLKRKKYIKAII